MTHFGAGDWVGVMANYWDSHEFESARGDRIYQSISDTRIPTLFHYRKMVMLRPFVERNLHRDLKFIARLNNIYDLNQKTFDLVPEFPLGTFHRIRRKRKRWVIPEETRVKIHGTRKISKM